MSRASVNSQKSIQPLLLKHRSMSSDGSFSTRSAHDSVVQQRSSWKPPPSARPANHHPRLSNSAPDEMAPTYRLRILRKWNSADKMNGDPRQQYPKQSDASSRRSVRASKSREHNNLDSSGLNVPHSSHPSISGDSIGNRYSHEGDFSPNDRLSSQRSVPDLVEFEDDEHDPSLASGATEESARVASARQRQTYRTRRQVTRRPSGSVASVSLSENPEAIAERGYNGAGDRSSAGSTFSQETAATSVQTLPALQTKGPDNSDAQQLEPVLEDDPRSWDLVPPAEEEAATGIYELERRAEQLFSSDHLRAIFDDPKLLLKFTGFLNSHRPASIPILIYYLDALKALRAINYANAIAEALAPLKNHSFTQETPDATVNVKLEERAEEAFEILARDDLPAYIAHTWVQVVSVSIQRRIVGTLAPHLREASEGLAEVFCLSDPSRPDNPIVFASEEFARTTQYGMSYAIGRNCRFLQGPRSDPYAVRRLGEALVPGREREHVEVLVNYRRDGSPFLNLLLTAPLMDSRGNVRYFIGAQVDVSGLLKDCSNMDGLVKLVAQEDEAAAAARNAIATTTEDDEDDSGDGLPGAGGGAGAGSGSGSDKDPFQELSEMFNGAELDTVRRYGGRMHKEYVDESDRDSIVGGGRPRLLLKDPSQDLLDSQREALPNGGSGQSSVPSAVRERINGKLDGVYSHYLLIRPAPSLRILFTSPSLRVPGILQSPFLHRIGGSARVRGDLHAALAEGRGVTAKIRWRARPDADGAGEGRPRWIHCTPLLGHSGAVGVWMVVLVDEEGSSSRSGGGGGGGGGASGGRANASANEGTGRFRRAPPVATVIGGKEWNGRSWATSAKVGAGAATVAAAAAAAAGGDKRADSRAESRTDHRSAGVAPGSSVAGGGSFAGGGSVGARSVVGDPGATGETLLHEDALDVHTPTPSQVAGSEFSFQLK